MNVRQWYVSKVLIKAAYKAKKVNGLPASIMAAQAIWETGWLKHIPKDINTGEVSNNLFGIKASIHPYVWSISPELFKGKYVDKLSKFKKFKNYEESFVGYGNLILNNSRYSKAVEDKNDPRQYIEEIWKAGYCTDSHLYVEGVISIAEMCGFIPKEMS